MTSQITTASRRGFLQATGTAAAAAAGTVLASSSVASAATASDYEWDDEADVILVGAGTAMMAAIKAAEAGARVIVLEKNGFLGGDMAVNGGIIYATETSVMKNLGGVIDPRTGEEDTIDRMVEDWMRHAKGGANEAMVRTVAEGGPALIDWFKERGLNFGLYQSGNDPVTRGHQWTSGAEGDSTPTEGAGYYFAQAMAEEFEKLGVVVYTSTKGMEIITDERNNILGVKARDEKGAVKLFGCKAVILATGGAGDNPDLTMQYNPEAVNWLNDGVECHTGDGYIMSEPLGAARVGHLNWFDPVRPTPGLALMPEGVHTMEISAVFNYEFAQKGPRSYIWVNTDGKRFVDDTAGYVNGAPIAVAQTDAHYAWFVFDDALWDVDTFTDYYHGKEDGQIWDYLAKADTIEELAEQIEIDPEALVATIEKWNADCAAGEDTEFGRIAQSLMAIEKPPYYAYKLVPASDSLTLGPRISLDIDEQYRVLDRDGYPIPGLFAAGLALIWYRLVGYGYPGSGVACACMVGAGIAGESAARFALEA